MTGSGDQKGHSDTDASVSGKPALRRIMEIRRTEAFVQNPSASVSLRDLFIKAITLPPGAIIASYAPRGSEMNPEPLTDALRANGHTIALPVMAGRGQPLHFRLYAVGASLVANAAGIREPEISAPLLEPDVLLMPLLAFDRRRVRLGTGGGYYDRTLPYLRQLKPVLAIGLGFSCQELPEIPAESHDVPLDRIVTELQVFK